MPLLGYCLSLKGRLCGCCATTSGELASPCLLASSMCLPFPGFIRPFLS